ncbi:MAG: hypothetical protein WA230_08030, partial [Xanthobacteraceae bacterium]
VDINGHIPARGGPYMARRQTPTQEAANEPPPPIAPGYGQPQPYPPPQPYYGRPTYGQYSQETFPPQPPPSYYDGPGYQPYGGYRPY